MSIYQNIRNFGKKSFLVGSLVTALNGCTHQDYNIPYSTERISADVNNDGTKDLIYARRFFKGKVSSVPQYQLLIFEVLEDGTFKDTCSVMQLGSRKPIEIKVEDLNGDGNLDLFCSTQLYPEGLGSDAIPPRYLSIIAYGKGDGYFEEPKEIE